MLISEIADESSDYGLDLEIASRFERTASYIMRDDPPRLLDISVPLADQMTDLLLKTSNIHLQNKIADLLVALLRKTDSVGRRKISESMIEKLRADVVADCERIPSNKWLSLAKAILRCYTDIKICHPKFISDFEKVIVHLVQTNRFYMGDTITRGFAYKVLREGEDKSRPRPLRCVWRKPRPF